MEVLTVKLDVEVDKKRQDLVKKLCEDSQRSKEGLVVQCLYKKLANEDWTMESLVESKRLTYRILSNGDEQFFLDGQSLIEFFKPSVPFNEETNEITITVPYYSHV